MKKLFAAVLTTLAILILLPIQALALSIAPYHYIVDKAEILSSEFESEFELLLNDLEHETSAELIVLTIPSLEGLSIEGYAVETFRTWGIGQSASDNGVLLLVALEEREVRIEVGYGLEGAITDYQASGIIDQTFAPYFKVEDYEGGIAATINKLSVLIYNEANAEGFDNNPVGETYEYWYENEEMINSIIISMVAGLGMFTLFMASLGFFERKERKRYSKYPIPFFIMLAFVFFAQLNWLAWILCLGAGLFTQLVMFVFAHSTSGSGSTGSLEKNSLGGGGTSDSDSSSPSASSGRGSGGSSSSSGGNSGGFGGGSSGGGGASGSW